jgi:acyl carrier protein phosphodiesterase
MIKLLDILNEGEITDVDLHLNDHLKAIIKNATFALKSNDRKDISDSIGEIMKHTTFANDKNQFIDEKELDSFCQSTYLNLQNNCIGLPEKFLQMLPHMQQQNWLFHYSNRAGIEKSFGGLVRIAAYLSESDIAFSIFNTHYHELENCYQLFFPELKVFAAQYVSNINNQ